MKSIQNNQSVYYGAISSNLYPNGKEYDDVQLNPLLPTITTYGNKINLTSQDFKGSLYYGRNKLDGTMLTLFGRSTNGKLSLLVINLETKGEIYN